MTLIGINPISSYRSSTPTDTSQRSTSGPIDHDRDDFMKESMETGQGNLETLADSLTDRDMTIRRYKENGMVEIDLKRPDIERLVLSGGGAKGVAFSGMVKALEENQALDKIRSISGSSAGAISAAFLASGMDHAGFDKMSDETNLVSLLDSQNKVLGPLQHASSVLGKGAAKIPGKAGNIGRLLFDLMPRLQTKAMPLETLIREKMIESILARFNQARNDLQRELPEKVEVHIKEILKTNFVTFGDLEKLSKDIPEIKQLHITGTAMFDDRPQMVVFNASLTPDLDVAVAAHISGSLPVVFQKPSEQGLAFQADGERTAFQDGGIMLNTPVMELYEPQFPMSIIPESDQLILKFQSENDGKKNDRGTLSTAMADKFVGVAYSARDAQEADGIKAFEKSTVIVPLKTERGNFTGTIKGTVNFSMPIEDKNHLQQKLQSAVQMHLASRNNTSETYTFKSIDGALLALDDQLFNAAATALESDQASGAVITFRQESERALKNLQDIFSKAKEAQEEKYEKLTKEEKDETKTELVLTPEILGAIAELDKLAVTSTQTEWLAKRLNHGNALDSIQLLDTIKLKDATAPTASKSHIMTKAIEEMGVRDIATKSENFIREVIFPSVYRLDQPDSNIRLLKGAIADLRESTSAEGYNAVLHRIADQYVSRNFPNSSRPFNSTTVDQARAWLIPG
ncbi:patatin-like phospholipase family protein [Pseudomonas sp. NPDC086251]|uniref:patatin-like phospholipase family protein n=1 Tax=Pseudomonas sp. NPDC086251 TaxID=3364431 RepID=UPI003838F7D5